MILAGEAAVRDSLRQRVLDRETGALRVIYEFWMPPSSERADLVAIGLCMDAFEIKTERDSLRRLPRQAASYRRVFDRCTAVVATRHLAGTQALLPEWWGISTAGVDGDGRVGFQVVRQPSPNPDVDVEVLVRLLWRAEAMAALVAAGEEPDPRASRRSLWSQILEIFTGSELRSVVRGTLLDREPWRPHASARAITLSEPLAAR